MAKKKVLTKTAFKTQDITQWNFVLFLTLAFILLVVMLIAMSGVSKDIRSKAGLICPDVTLPRAEDCAGGWKYQRDITNGCPTFVCEAK